MKKAIKILCGIVIAIVALVLILVLTLPIWLGPVVKPIANAAVPKFTGTPFHLGVLSLNPYSGRFELGDMQLGNPPNYDEKQAVTLNKLVVDVGMSTLADEYIHVEEVTVDGVFVSYVDADGVNNFQQIQFNAAGGKEKYDAAQTEKKAVDAKAEPKTAEKKPADKGAQKKLVIDKLVINDIKFKYGFVTLPVPSITLTDLGKKSDGITLKELGDQIMQAIMKSSAAIGDGVKALGGFAGKGAKAVSEGAGKAADAVGEGAKTVGEGAGKAVDAVGEGAKKTVDALKSLF